MNSRVNNKRRGKVAATPPITKDNRKQQTSLTQINRKSSGEEDKENDLHLKQQSRSRINKRLEAPLVHDVRPDAVVTAGA